MARAISDDLRCRILTAYEEGEASLAAVARRFAVGVDYVKKIRKQQLKSGRKERPVGQRRGPPPRITPELEEHLRAWLAAQPDLTLEELQGRLQEQDGVWVCASVLCTRLQGMGLPRKKKRCMPPNRTPRKDGSGARTGASKPSRSTRSNWSLSTKAA